MQGPCSGFYSSPPAPRLPSQMPWSENYQLTGWLLIIGLSNILVTAPEIEKEKEVIDSVKKWRIGNLLMVSDLSDGKGNELYQEHSELVPCLPLFSWAFDRGVWESEPYFLHIFLAILTLQSS